MDYPCPNCTHDKVWHMLGIVYRIARAIVQALVVIVVWELLKILLAVLT